jgi:hypothetical protein
MRTRLVVLLYDFTGPVFARKLMIPELIDFPDFGILMSRFRPNLLMDMLLFMR